MSFFAGFVGVTVVGIVARILGRSWAIIEAERARMTSPPHPIPKRIERTRIHGIDTDPDSSPIEVLNRGCVRIGVQILFQILLWSGIVLVLIILPVDVRAEEIPEEAWIGALFAAILGLLLNAIVSNWRVIEQLYRRMINPPKPTLPFERPPNIHDVAAAPPLSPQSVVVGGCFEIMLRIVLEMFLLVGLGLLFREMFRYLFG